jgi:hypothetical protein
VSDPAAEWAEILDPGERLLWVGSPAGGVRFSGKAVGTTFFGLFFLGFALFWTAGAATPLFMILTGEDPPDGFTWFFVFFPLFGLPFIAVGAWMVFGQHFHDAWRRRHMRYALTDRRAIITSWAGGKRSLQSFPITPATTIDYQPGDESNLYFHTKVSIDSDGDRRTERIGFEHFPDGEGAYAAIRQIQRLPPP